MCNAQVVSSSITAILIPFTMWAKSIFRKLGRRENGCFKINTTREEITSSISESPQAFPTILELAQLSQHAYTISYLQDDTDAPLVIEHMEDWICIGTGRYSDGYCGAAYVNYKYSHVVIAHGGTEFIKEFYRDFICTDIGGIGLNKEVSQISSAYIFTKIIVNLCSDTQFSISVTGHSLGGWLAQICAFYIAHPTYISQNQEVKKVIGDKQKELNITDSAETRKAYHLHTVSFDSPGCRPALKRIVGLTLGHRYGRKMVEWRNIVDSLDFTVIIAPSNIINTCGKHVGYVLTLEMTDVQEISWVSASHSILLFVKHLSLPKPKLKEVLDVRLWKAVQSEVESIILDQWYLGRAHSFQAHIFSPIELAFISLVQIILNSKIVESLKTSKPQIEERHQRARDIFNSIESELLSDFLLNFIVTHNAIELKNKSPITSKDISNLFILLRQNRDLLDGNEFLRVIQNLPGYWEIMCQSGSSLYIKRLPKLKDRECTINDLCGKVEDFIESGKHFWHINASRDGRQSRLYMMHLYNCFDRPYKAYSDKPALFMNISVVQNLNSSIDNMEEIFSQINCGLIVLECDSKINKEMNDVITRMIAKVKFEKKKLIIVTSGDNVPGLQNSHPIAVALELRFNNLNESSERIIAKCHCDIHGNTVMLGKSDPPCGQYLLKDLGSFFNSVSPKLCAEIICDIFDGKIIDLSGGSLPVMAEHYIPRTLYQITLNVGKLKMDEKKFSEILVISNSDKSTETLIPDTLFQRGLVHKKDEKYSKECFLNDCSVESMSGNVHWFKQEKVNGRSMLVWQISNCQPCFDYLIDENDEVGIPDSDIHRLQNKFIILADEPGMGKSVGITKLFLEYESLGSHFNWPVYINLNHHQVELKDTVYTSDSAINFLTKASDPDCEFQKSLLRLCLKETGNVTFFIDSFDEISQKGQDFVVQMLQHLRHMTHSKIRVWIATRNYAKYELEKRLGTKSYRFHRIKLEAQITFLANNWTHNVAFEQRKIINSVAEFKFAEKFAGRAIEKIREVLGQDHTFIGIPLQLVLIAAIYKDKFQSLLEKKVRDSEEGIALSLSESEWENSSDKFSSTLELYDLFVNRKMNIWLGDKSRLDTRTDWQEGTLKSRMSKIHCQAAFLYVSSSILTNSDVNLEAESLSPTDSNEVNRIGFCERIVEWGITMSIPQNVFKRIRKANSLKAEQCLDIVFLTLKNAFIPDMVMFHKILQGLLNADIEYGTECDLSEMKLNSSRQIHWFKVIRGSHLAWQRSTLKLPETTVTESVEIEISESTFRFYHQTIAEYFTAKYLVNDVRKDHNNQSKIVSFLKTHYNQPYFKKIRYFLDSLLCTDIPVLENLELLDTGGNNLKEQSLHDRFKNGVWDGVDALGRNLLHYAMAYGDHDSGIFWIIAKGFSLFHKKDHLGETCLSYFCLSEGFPIRIYSTHFKYQDYRREILEHKKFGKIVKDFPRHIIGAQVLYSIFCGSNFEVLCIESDLKAMELNTSSGVALDGFMIPFNFNASINRDMFLHSIKNTDVDQLTKNVEINMTWLSHYVENEYYETFLERLCLHNSLDNRFLNEWFETCLSEKADNRSSKLGTTLIGISKRIDKYEYVLQILRNNLPHYYHNALPYMDGDHEYDLWKSCLDIKDRRKMLLVMKNYNFYPLLRAIIKKSPLVKGVTDFVYNESGGEFRGAMNEGLAKVFHVFIFSNIEFSDSFAFAIYEVSDEEAKEQMMMENFEFQTNDVVHDKPKLSFKSAQTIFYIMEGKNNLWALRYPRRIMIRDSLYFLQRQFYTLPLLCDYPKECVLIRMSSD